MIWVFFWGLLYCKIILTVLCCFGDLCGLFVFMIVVSCMIWFSWFALADRLFSVLVGCMLLIVCFDLRDGM